MFNALVLFLFPFHVAGECTLISVQKDATYCIDGSETLCAGLYGTCPRKGEIALSDCFPYLSSFHNISRQCVLPISTICQLLETGAYGCRYPSDYDGVPEDINKKSSSEEPCPLGLSYDSFCTTSEECGNWNGHSLVCDVSHCTCPVGNQECLTGITGFVNQSSQFQVCSAEIPCLGAGKTGEKRGGEIQSKRCALPTACIQQFNSKFNGQCMTELDCDPTKDIHFNCSVKILAAEMPTPPHNTAQKEKKGDTSKKPSSFGLADESLSVQITTSIIVLVLLVAFVTLFVFRFNWRSNSSAAVPVEADWSTLSTPDTSPSLIITTITT